MNREDTNIRRLFGKLKGFAETRELLAAGIHQRDIKRMRDEGQIIRLRKGLYRPADIPLVSNQGFVDLAHAAPEGVICLLSALSYYDLTTHNPSIIAMAIRRGSREPRIEHPPVEFYRFSKEQFEAGVNQVKIGESRVRIYYPEKTICDCFRYRGKLGLDIAKEGLAEYLKRRNRNLEKLLEYADICRVKPLLKTWLDALV
jgi:predicted transcriptional regulator of viral defense system